MVDVLIMRALIILCIYFRALIFGNSHMDADFGIGIGIVLVWGSFQCRHSPTVPVRQPLGYAPPMNTGSAILAVSKGVSKSVQVLSNGAEADTVLTLFLQ